MKKLFFLFSLVLVSSLVFSGCTASSKNFNQAPSPTAVPVKDTEEQLLQQLEQDEDLNMDSLLEQLEKEL